MILVADKAVQQALRLYHSLHSILHCLRSNLSAYTLIPSFTFQWQKLALLLRNLLTYLIAVRSLDIVDYY
jgi:hypothetical protein